MKKDLYKFMKSLEDLEIKTIQDLRLLDKKLKQFKVRTYKKPESIENRVKLIMVDNIRTAIKQEQFVFKQATECSKKKEIKLDKDIDALFEQIKQKNG